MTDVSRKIRDVLEAEGQSFTQLVELAGLDRATDFRHMNLREVDFSNCDLADFNFSGSKIHGADFTSALISRAVFDSTQLSMDELRAASDYEKLILPSESSSSKNTERNQLSTRPSAVLCILDGWGISEEQSGNAVMLAKTPTYDRIMNTCPNATLITHGPDVGLPTGQMGNSEVGHTNIGAGRIVMLDLGRIDLTIERGEFQELSGIQNFVRSLHVTGGSAHLLGLVSPGGVHGHIDHIIETARVLRQYDIPVIIHGFTDGRDVSERSALEYLARLSAQLPPDVLIGSVTGRQFAMDRDSRWERTEASYRAIVLADGTTFDDEKAVVEQSYSEGTCDEIIAPHVNSSYKGMKDGDGVISTLFRADRIRQLMSAMADPDFTEFDVSERPKFSIVSGFAEYSHRHNQFMDCIFPINEVVNTLPEWISKNKLTQFHVAETEKYPHVTFFLSSGKEKPTTGETRFMVSSPNVPTYNQAPEMAADEVTDKVLEAITKGYDLVVVNYANPDMVGHTGELNAAIKACEKVDEALDRVLRATIESKGTMLLVSDHGNCETMLDLETGKPHTAHTLNPVPVAVIGYPPGFALRNGRLADVAPTLLDLMRLPQPEEMTGRSLLVR